jgi:serine/threonine protein kinase
MVIAMRLGLLNLQMRLCSGTSINNYSAIIMEAGQIDVASYLHSLHSHHASSYHHDVKIIGYEMCEILEHLHREQIVWMDFKPSNIVRVISSEDTIVYHKAIDFDSAVDIASSNNHIKYLDRHSAHVTARYVSPEVAKYIWTTVQNKDQQSTLRIPITTAIDIFALGLTIFELLNPRHNTLWEELGVVDIHNDQAILQYAAESLTSQHMINEVLQRCFPGIDNRAIQSWLHDALCLVPQERWDATALKTRHSLFSAVAGATATLDITKLVRKEDLQTHEKHIKEAIVQSTNVIVERIQASEERILYENAMNFHRLQTTVAS